MIGQHGVSAMPESAGTLGDVVTVTIKVTGLSAAVEMSFEQKQKRVQLAPVFCAEILM